MKNQSEFTEEIEKLPDFEEMESRDEREVFKILDRRVSKGELGLLESSIKSHYKAMYEAYRTGEEIWRKDSVLEELENPANLMKDAPNFEYYLPYLLQLRTRSTELLNEMSYLTSEEGLYHYKDSNLKGDYRNQYYHYALKVMRESEEQDWKAMVEEVNSDIDRLIGILTYLKENQGSWYMEEEQFFFTSQEALDGFQQMITP